MKLSPALEWTLFLVLSAGALAGASRMLRTMSMVRAGIFLMGSFCSVAGLFLLLSADLLAAMQIMMYVGGMLVMIVFMVMMSPDPGGATMGIAPPEDQKQHNSGARDYFCPMHPEVRSSTAGKCRKCGMQLQPSKSMQEPHGAMQMDMAMTHEFTKIAAMLGVVISVALVVVILRAKWPAAAALDELHAPMTIGKELLGRYMIAFEGAAILIIVGVVGAVILGRREE